MSITTTWASCSGPAGWVRSIAPTIRGCRGRSRSRCSPRDSGTDPDRLRRFEQEALAVARLAHPNILAVHDIGTFEGSPYLVTELLEGQTLREAMNDWRLSPRKALDCTRQVAQGLAAAHEHGIVHRDIKPENLFVTKEGRVKILDFGIAKLTDLEPASGASSATLTAHGLGPVGTAAYMSPEQARGDRTDFRSDLFSLGVVLYEMVAGVSPFRRATAPETMTAILREDPPELAIIPCRVFPGFTVCSSTAWRRIPRIDSRRPAISCSPSTRCRALRLRRQFHARADSRGGSHCRSPGLPSSR